MEVIIAGTIFIVSLGLIMTERVHRTIVAISGAALMSAVGLVFGFYTEELALEAIDFNTIGLLSGMMLLVAVLEPTGFFEFVAVRAAQLSRGKPWRLMLMLGIGTSILSFFLNNVTAAVLIAPVAIMLAELMGMNPIPYLMAVGFSADTAGVATSIGDPASILVASASGYTFNQFLTHSLPIVSVALIATLVLLRIMFRKEFSSDRSDRQEVLNKLNTDEIIRDAKTLNRVLIVLLLTIGLFVFQESLGVTPAFIALAGSALVLIWVRPNVNEVLDRVDWSVIVFFLGLFVMVGALEATGVFEAIAEGVARIADRPVVLGIIIIWAVALLSGLVDNVPVTIAMIPVLQGLGRAGVDISALWWALAFGAGFGGDATVVGSTVNLVVVELSERTATPIRPREWSRWGVPVTIVNCTIASILFALFFDFLSQ